MVNFYHVIERRRIPNMAKANNCLHPWDVFMWFLIILFVTKRSASSAYKLIRSFICHPIYILLLREFLLLFTANNKPKSMTVFCWDFLFFSRRCSHWTLILHFLRTLPWTHWTHSLITCLKQTYEYNISLESIVTSNKYFIITKKKGTQIYKHIWVYLLS